MTKHMLNAIEQTKTAQVRRLEVPLRGRKVQAAQVRWALLFGVLGSLFCYVLGLSWHFTAMVWLLSLRIASKRALKDIVKVVAELAGLLK